MLWLRQPCLSGIFSLHLPLTQRHSKNWRLTPLIYTLSNCRHPWWKKWQQIKGFHIEAFLVYKYLGQGSVAWRLPWHPAHWNICILRYAFESLISLGPVDKVLLCKPEPWQTESLRTNISNRAAITVKLNLALTGPALVHHVGLFCAWHTFSNSYVSIATSKSKNEEKSAETKMGFEFRLEPFESSCWLCIIFRFPICFPVLKTTFSPRSLLTYALVTGRMHGVSVQLASAWLILFCNIT